MEEIGSSLFLCDTQLFSCPMLHIFLMSLQGRVLNPQGRRTLYLAGLCLCEIAWFYDLGLASAVALHIKRDIKSLQLNWKESQLGFQCFQTLKETKGLIKSEKSKAHEWEKQPWKVAQNGPLMWLLNTRTYQPAVYTNPSREECSIKSIEEKIL